MKVVIKFLVLLCLIIISTSLNLSSTRNSVPASDAEKKIILDTHNLHRNQIATQTYLVEPKLLPFATNMLQMYWNNEIANKAQTISQKCQFKESSENERKWSNLKLGENMQIELGETKPDWKKVISSWFVGISAYKNKNLDSFRSGDMMSNTFSQLVWANSYVVGCGHTLCADGASFYVCLYGPSGNVAGKPLFKYSSKKECKCPKETTCGNKDYPGLCCPAGHCTKDSVEYNGKPIEGLLK